MRSECKGAKNAYRNSAYSDMDYVFPFFLDLVCTSRNKSEGQLNFKNMCHLLMSVVVGILILSVFKQTFNEIKEVQTKITDETKELI
jgi:hypothetical protein